MTRNAMKNRNAVTFDHILLEWEGIQMYVGSESVLEKIIPVIIEGNNQVAAIIALFLFFNRVV